MIMRHRFTVAILALIAAISCNPTAEPQKSEAVKLTATLAPYFGSGKTEIPVWNSADVLVLANLKNSSSCNVKPAVTGTNESLFSLIIDDTEDGDRMIAFRKAGDSDFKNGTLEFTLPVNQDGQGVKPVLASIFEFNTGKTSGEHITLSTTNAVLLVNIILDNYKITEFEVSSNAGENFVGLVTLNTADGSYSATQSKVKVDMKNYTQNGTMLQVPVAIAPCVLSKGYHITCTTDKGTTFEYNNTDAIEIAAGEVVETGKTSEDTVRKLLVCGSNKVYLFNKELVDWGESYAKGLIWSWDCSSIQSICPGAKTNSHIDDTKIVNDKRQLLITCSNNNGWCVLIEPDYSQPTGAKLLFWTNKADNAHSAELLPGGYLVVACSTGSGQCLQLYDITKNNTVLAEYPLNSAHGAVWNPATERLYAIGETTLQIYKWDPTKPELEIEESISTTSYVKGLHDISIVDANTLIMGAQNCALYDISRKTFTPVPIFSKTSGIKSLNYNAKTGEIFYTISGGSPNYSWSTYTLRYNDKIDGTGTEKTIMVNDIEMYKARVFTW